MSYWAAVFSLKLKQQRDLIQNFRIGSTSRGVAARIGSFSIGGGGSHSQHFSDIRNASSGTTIRIEDKSDQIYVIGSVSVRVSDLVNSPGFAVAPLIEEIDAELAAMDQQSLSQIQAEANDLGVITP